MKPLGENCTACGANDWQLHWTTRMGYERKHDKESKVVRLVYTTRRCIPCRQARDAKLYKKTKALRKSAR